MDAQEEYWHETNPAVIFMIALQDLNQPHSCEDWGEKGIEGYPLIVEDPGTMFTWLHDSWNAFPTYAILDHTMTVRAKPWPYSSNGNSNSCDGTNNTIDNWNGGDANDFIAQLIEECGSLCDPCDSNDPNDSDGDGIGDDCDNCEGYDDNLDADQDEIPDGCDDCPDDFDNDIDGDGICGDIDLFPDCHNQAGDLNDDLTIDIQDIVLMLTIILEESDSISACQLKDADFNGDRIVNINDIIGMISIIINN